MYWKKPMNRRGNNQRGSLTLEALLVMTMLMVVLFTILGFVYSEQIEVEVISEMQAISKDMSVLMMVPLNTTDYVQKTGATAVLNAWGQSELESRFKNKVLMRHIDVSESYLDNEEIYMWYVRYQIVLPLLTIERTHVIPVSAVYDQDLLENDAIVVYITRTGECYHEETCYHLRQSKIRTSQFEAIRDGYRACKNCMKFVPLE